MDRLEDGSDHELTKVVIWVNYGMSYMSILWNADCHNVLHYIQVLTIHFHNEFTDVILISVNIVKLKNIHCRFQMKKP